ncbi:MAG TPA: oligoendopeptidase, partial [Candidatus Eisenbacteria bacterium]|nr:oligoendopeptidase [Candidatus Eisenbacteria bacterium]
MPPVTTDTETQASDVVWDLEPLVDRQGDPGLDRLLDEAARRAKTLAVHRGRIASMDAAALASLMHEVETISDLLGRAGSYAELRFAADTL